MKNMRKILIFNLILSLTLVSIAGIFTSKKVFASAPVFVNNGTANTGVVYPSSTYVLGLNIDLPPIDTDTFLDGDGTSSASASSQDDTIAAGDSLIRNFVLTGTFCANTTGTTAPTSLVIDTGGVCTDADTTGETVVLGNNSALNNIDDASSSQVVFNDENANGSWNSGEDIFFDEDDSEYYNRDELDAITVRNLGTAVYSTDIYTVQMWKESGVNLSNTFGTDDTLVDSYCAWDGANDWECGDDTSQVITGAGTTPRIYITYDLTNAYSAINGRTIQFQIAALSDTGTLGAFDTGDTGIFFSKAGAAGTGNHDGPTSAITNDSTKTIGVIADSPPPPPPPPTSSSGGSPATPNNTEVEIITDESGGTVTETAANDGSTATVDVESGTTEGDASFTVMAFSTNEVYASDPLPSELQPGGRAVFDISASVGGTAVTTFDVQPLSLSFTYRENQLVQGASENDLRLAVFDQTEDNWHVLEDAVVDTSTNTITYTANHLTRFAIVRPADIIRPALPTNVSVAAISGGAKLLWQNPPTDFHHVRITRGLTAEDAGTLIANDERGTSYEDISALSEPVYYKIVSVDLAGNRSGPAMVLFDPSVLSHNDGDLLRGESSSEVWITHNSGGKMFKRHVLFSNFDTFYPHLAPFWSNVEVVSDSTVAAYSLSAWIRLDGTAAVYEVNDDNTKHWITCNDDSVVGQDCANEWILSGRDFDGVYVVNSVEFNSYVSGPTVIMPDVEN